MEFERTKRGEMMALARLMNVTEEEIIDRARWVQFPVNDISDLREDTCGYVLACLYERVNGEEEEWEDNRTDEEKWWDGYWAHREDDIEARDLDRAIEKGWL